MRGSLPLVLLCALAYVGWYYYQHREVEPLRAKLLRLERDEVDRFTVRSATAAPFHGTRDPRSERWTVYRDARQIEDHRGSVTSLLDLLTNLRTDSLIHLAEAPDRQYELLVGAGSEHDALSLNFGDRSTPPVAWLTDDDHYYALPLTSRRLLPYLELERYYDLRLVPQRPAGADTVRMLRGDTLLWQLTGDSATVFQRRHLTPDRPLPFAAFFDPLQHDRYRIGRLMVHRSGYRDSVRVYHNVSWPRPVVLSSGHFPRQHYSLDSLPQQ